MLEKKNALKQSMVKTRKVNIFVTAAITVIVVSFACFPLNSRDFGAHAAILPDSTANDFPAFATATPQNTFAPTPTPDLSPEPTSTPTLTPNLTESSAPTQTPSTPKLTFFFGHPTIGSEFSTLRPPNTITVCNFTTPNDTGSITQISIYLTGEPSGSNVRAVIYKNDPESKLPTVQQLLAQSTEDLNVTSITGGWYNFTITFNASPNTTYWFGYYSDHFTRYYYDNSTDHISGTSANTTLSTYFPNLFAYDSSTMMSLYVIYAQADPNSKPSPTQTSSPEPQVTQNSTSPTSSPYPTSSSKPQVAQNSSGEIDVTIIILAETMAAIFYYNHVKKRVRAPQIGQRLKASSG